MMIGKWKDKVTGAAKGAADKAKDVANDVAGTSKDAFDSAAGGVKQLTELSQKLGRDFSSTLNRTQIMDLVTKAGQIPMIGKPFQAIVILNNALEFAASLPGQTARTITNDHLTDNDPLVIIPMEKFVMVLSFSDETDWQCNFYTNDSSVINRENLPTLRGDRFVERGLKSDEYGIDRVSFANEDGFKRYPQVSQTPEKGIASAIEMALGYVPGYDYVTFVPGVEEQINKATTGIAKVVVNTVVADLTNDMDGPDNANDNVPA